MKKYITLIITLIISLQCFASLDSYVSEEYFGYSVVRTLNKIEHFETAKRITEGNEKLTRRTFASLIAIYINKIDELYVKNGYVEIDIETLAGIEKMILDFLNEIELLFSDNLFSLSQKITTLEMSIAQKSRSTGLLKPHYDYSRGPESFKQEQNITNTVNTPKEVKENNLKEVAKVIEEKAIDLKQENSEVKKEILHPDFDKMVSFNAFNIPVKFVFDALIENTSLSLFVSPDINNMVSVQIKDMKLINALKRVSEQANCLLEIEGTNINLKSKDEIIEKVIKLNFANLDHTVDFLNKIKSTRGRIISNPLNNSIIIYDTVASVKKMEESMKDIDIKDEGSEIETKVIMLKYAEAQDVLSMIQNLKSDSGRIAANTRANSLIIVDKQSNIKGIENLISKLDIPSFEARQTTFIYNVRYGDAANIINILKSDAFAGSVAKDVKMVTDERTNSVVLTGTNETINKIIHYVEQLDVRTKQVTIMAKIIEVTLDDNNSNGVNWSMLAPTGASNKTMSEENRIDLTTFDSFGENRARMKFGTLAREQVEMVFERLISTSDAKVISNPTITTLNNQEARILIGEKIPFEETTTTEGNTSSSVSFKDVGITLTVTPKISPDNYVTLKVRPEISQQSGLTTKGEPIIGTTEADTNVIIKNGETLVIGGLIKNNNVRTVSSIPVLGDIPFLRNAFRSVRVVSKKTETIVLITPHVIEDVIRNTTMHMEKYNVIGEQEAFNG
ncbi:MAG: secretin N-terminal domain-containing protein [Candidatus Muiribacteriota bacterium]